MRKALAVILLPAAFALDTGPVRAASGDPIGSSVVVVNKVTALIAQNHRTLRQGDDVRQDELIEVANNGRSELKLRDETKLALGPGARLMLDKFVYDPDQPAGSIAIRLVKGAFRFVTGLAAKPSYVVRVPNASITVRGTIFDVFVAPDNSAWLLLHEGAVEACTDAGQCRVLDEPGKLIRISGGAVGTPERWASLPGRQTIAFDNAFPFLSRTPTFDPTPVFTRNAILLGLLPIRPQRPGAYPPPTPPPARKAGQNPTPNFVRRVHPSRILRKGVINVKPYAPKVLKPPYVRRKR